VARLIDQASVVAAAGAPPKVIREPIGRVNTGTDAVSVTHMSSPAGRAEPWQTPEFDEWTLVISGTLLVEDEDEDEDEDGRFATNVGQAVHAPRRRRVRYWPSVCRHSRRSWFTATANRRRLQPTVGGTMARIDG
jgi:hypothetical protein